MCATQLKHAMIIEDCDVIFVAISIRKVMLTKKRDVNYCEILLTKSLLKVRNFFELFLIDILQIEF